MYKYVIIKQIFFIKDTRMEFIYLLIILILAFGIKTISHLKIEHSIFITVCSFFIIEFVFGLIANLNTGYYIIISLTALSFFYLLYMAIKRRLKYIESLTPGLVLFALSFVIYYLSSKGAMVYLWDEATHWGTSAKRMAYTAKLWTTGLQTIASPVFNFVMLKTTGFKESALYLSQWTLSIACLILPLSHIKWKKAYLAIIYFVGGILGLSLICQNGNLTLYADNILALFFSSMVLAWYLEKEFSFKKYIWACFGIFMLVQIKSGTGMSLAILFIIFTILLDRLLLNKEFSRKQHLTHSLRSIAILFTIMIISQKMYSDFNNLFLGRESSFSGSLMLFKASPLFTCFIVSALIFISIIIIYMIYIYKNKIKTKSYKWIKTSLIIIGVLTTLIFGGLLLHGAILRPDFDIRTTVINFILAFSKYTILGISMKYICLIIIGLLVLNILLSDKKSRKESLIFYLLTFITFGMYVGGILYTYIIKFSLHEAVITASFDRYMSTALLFSFMLVLVPFLRKAKRSKNQILKYSTLIIMLILMFSQWTPTFKLVEKTSNEAKEIRIDKKHAGDYVKSLVNEEDRVFIVIQKDPGLNFHWMRYELLPLSTNGGYWSYGDGGWNYAWEPKHLRNFFIKADYSYLYLHKTDDTFNERFIDLFGGIIPEARTLYKFSDEDDIKFSKVD